MPLQGTTGKVHVKIMRIEVTPRDGETVQDYVVTYVVRTDVGDAIGSYVGSWDAAVLSIDDFTDIYNTITTIHTNV